VGHVTCCLEKKRGFKKITPEPYPNPWENGATNYQPHPRDLLWCHQVHPQVWHSYLNHIIKASGTTMWHVELQQPNHQQVPKTTVARICFGEFELSLIAKLKLRNTLPLKLICEVCRSTSLMLKRAGLENFRFMDSSLPFHEVGISVLLSWFALGGYCRNHLGYMFSSFKHRIVERSHGRAPSTSSFPPSFVEPPKIKESSCSIPSIFDRDFTSQEPTGASCQGPPWASFPFPFLGTSKSTKASTWKYPHLDGGLELSLDGSVRRRSSRFPKKTRKRSCYKRLLGVAPRVERARRPHANAMEAY